MRTMTEQVADALLGRIQQEKLEPGHRLGREQDLAQEFGVSRPTMREAIQLLSSGGLLRATKGPGGGIFVDRTFASGLSHSLSQGLGAMLDIDAVTLEELMQARIAVEIPIVRAAAERIDDATLAELESTIASIEAGPHDGRHVQEGDRRFHHAIAQASGNLMLQAIVGWVFDVLQPRLYRAIPPATVEDVVVTQHRAILEALSRRDVAAAEQAMREHLEHLRDLAADLTASPTGAG